MMESERIHNGFVKKGPWVRKIVSIDFLRIYGGLQVKKPDLFVISSTRSTKFVDRHK